MHASRNELPVAWLDSAPLLLAKLYYYYIIIIIIIIITSSSSSSSSSSSNTLNAGYLHLHAWHKPRL